MSTNSEARFRFSTRKEILHAEDPIQNFDFFKYLFKFNILTSYFSGTKTHISHHPKRNSLLSASGLATDISDTEKPRN